MPQKVKLNPNAERLRLYLGGFAKAYNLTPGELTGVFLALAHDTYVDALGAEISEAHWLWLASTTYEKLTPPAAVEAAALPESTKG
jgi:hypothetical protein